MRINLVVCNVCKDTQRDTREYRITSEGRRATVDLCDEHGAPLEQLLGAEAEEGKPPRKRAPARLERRVMTMEEVEARKGRNS